MKPEPRVIAPQAGYQMAYASSSADIVVGGGAAGSGKTFSLLLEPLRHIGNKKFGAVIFRKTNPQISMEGGLWDESRNIYPALGAKGRETPHYDWSFPSGAGIHFRHMQYESNVLDWQGSQIPLILWDELTHFSERTFWYMLSRNRSTCGVRPYIRATCNPDPDSFVADLVDWWIAEDGYADLSRSGIIRWFYRVDDRLRWYDSKAGAMAAQPYMEQPPKSFTFIPGTIFDNKILLQKDPGYLANLMALHSVDRLRLLGDKKRGGNWKVRPTAGKIFNRDWFQIVDEVPLGGDAVLFWDFAGTEKDARNPDPDYTAAVLILRIKDPLGEGNQYTYFVMFCYARQISPAEVDKEFLRVTRQLARWMLSRKATFCVRWEEEPGSASKRESRRLVKMLGNVAGKGVRSSKDKVQRAKPFASQCEARNVYLLRGDWNKEWIRLHHGFPDLSHDDIVDGSSGAFSEVNRVRRGKRYYGTV